MAGGSGCRPERRQRAIVSRWRPALCLIARPVGNDPHHPINPGVPAMTARLPILVLPALAVLASCGPNDQFAPACPSASLLPQAADLTLYRPGSAHDLTDLVLQGRVVNIDGKCEPGPNQRLLDATVKVTMELTRGPSAPSRTTAVTYFVAVSEGDQILDKHVYSNQVTFPPNIDRLWLVSDPVFMRLPVSPQKSGAAYTVWAGFQFSPAEVAEQKKP